MNAAIAAAHLALHEQRPIDGAKERVPLDVVGAAVAEPLLRVSHEQGGDQRARLVRRLASDASAKLVRARLRLASAASGDADSSSHGLRRALSECVCVCARALDDDVRTT